jgi:uncharacterized protein (DUF488 family)
MAFPYFTIGHSTRPIIDFVNLLTASEIDLIVDVRTIPRSLANPQYTQDALPGSLSDFQIAYEHIAELGGRRARAGHCGRRQCLLGEPELSQLRRLCVGRRFPFRPRQTARTGQRPALCRDVRGGSVVCHRRIIADYLLVAGEQVFHILGPKAVAPASLTRAATQRPDGALTYPALAVKASNINNVIPLTI